MTFDPEPDPDAVECLRSVAEDLQGGGSEAELLAALLYRVSDLYDPAEDTSPRDVFTNMRTILLEKSTADE